MADSERQEQVVAMTLAALLEELKEVDAETHDEYFKLVEKTYWDHWPIVLADPETHEYSPESEIIYNSIVQSCIQRACERREWYAWNVGANPYLDQKYRATIGVICESHISDHIVIDNMAAECGDSPAEALLAAYIAAVKEEAER